MRVLLLCTSHNDLGLIYALRKLGAYVIATGARERSPGERLVDEWIKADYSDEELILSIAKQKQIDRVVACCNDYGVYTAAYVAEKMDLPGYDSYEVTLTLHNKDKFKAFAKEYGIRTPESTGFIDEKDAKKYIEGMTLPVIVKPVDCSAGNGISVVREAEEIEGAVSYAFSRSKRARIVAEPFIDGTQHGFCTFLINKKVKAYCSNNEYSILNPYRVEIDTFPADHTDEAAPILINEIEKMAEILDLKDGIFHLQYMYKEGNVQIIEVMRRTVGNMYHRLGNPINGLYWEYWEARARMGMSCEDFPANVNQEGCYAYKTILSNEDGVIEKIEIPDEYNKYIFDTYMLKKAGNVIQGHKSDPVGFLFMMFPDKNTMRSVLIDHYRGDLVRMKDGD